MTRSSPPRGSLWGPALGVLSAAALAGCEFEPYAPTDLHYGLSDTSKAQLETLVPLFGKETLPAAAEAQILGALEMLFGTPQAPQMLLTQVWIDAEFDVNDWAYQLDDESWGQVLTENRARRFERQMYLIREGRFEEVPEPRWAMGLWADWQERLLPELLVHPDDPVDEDDPESLTWSEEALATFENHYPSLRESAEMFRVQCLHCHGIDGGGNGPTAQFLSPRPRDYRLGRFKFVSVDRNQTPRREDLLRILQYGVPTTAMASFARFSRGELEGLIDYVRLLTIRGQVETWLVGETVDSDMGILTPAEPLKSYDEIWKRWLAAESNYVAHDVTVPRPEEMTPERIAHGKELFAGNVANCYTCHGVYGRGNGESIFEVVNVLDKDGEVVTDADGNPVQERGPKTLDEWGNPSDPRNLQLGVFRGGSRPIDLYRRIKYGIGGTIMPAASTDLSDTDFFDLVYYVLSIAEENDPARIQEARHGIGGEEH